MQQTINEKLKAIMQETGDLCLTFYVPVEKVGADTRQGSVNLKKLIKQAEDQLRIRGIRSRRIHSLVEPVRMLVDNALFWEHQKQGLVLFVQPEKELMTWQLPIKVNLELYIMNRFNIRPLLPMLVQDGQFYLLALGRKETKLYCCSQEDMEELKVEGLPESLKAIYDQYEEEKQLQHHSSSGSKSSVFHGGSSSQKDSAKTRIEEYFRMIDASIAKVLPDSHTPVVLACVDYLHPIYKHVAKAGYIMDQHLSGSPDLTKPDQMRQQAWPLVEPIFSKPKEKAWDSCSNLHDTKRVITDVRLIFAALAHGRVEALFIKNKANLFGWYDEESGAIRKAAPEEQDELGVDDLLDLAAQKTLNSGRHVFVMSEEELGEDSDTIALLRY